MNKVRKCENPCEHILNYDEFLDEWKNITLGGSLLRKSYRDKFNDYFECISKYLVELGALPQESLPKGEVVYPCTDGILIYRALTKRKDGKQRKVRFGNWESFTMSADVLKSGYYAEKGLRKGIVIIARTNNSLHLIDEQEVVSCLRENDVINVLSYEKFAEMNV